MDSADKYKKKQKPSLLDKFLLAPEMLLKFVFGYYFDVLVATTLTS
jgi:hypothetical protein